MHSASRAKCYAAIILCSLLCSTDALATLTKTFISSKADDGSVLKMNDGSVWVVDEVDRVNSSVWVAADEVVIDDDSSACVHVQIIDTDEDGESVCASEVNSASTQKAVALDVPPTSLQGPKSEASATPAPSGGPTDAPVASQSVAYAKCGVGGTEVFLLSSATVPAVTVSTLKCGQRLTLRSEQGGWYRARTSDGTEGYISQWFLSDNGVTPTPNTTETSTPRPVVSNVREFQYTITFVTLQNGQVAHLMPNWAINWVKKNEKHYREVRFSTSEGPVAGAKNFVIAFSASSGAVQGFEPVTHTDTSTNTSPVSGSGTVTDNQGEMWNYTYEGTVTTTTTTTSTEQVPYTETSNTLYLTGFNEQGQMVSQRWHVFSSRTGGNPYNSAGYNLGSALASINARGHLLKKVVDDLVPRK